MTTRWRQGSRVPHHVYAQRGEEPDCRRWPDGDPPIAMFLDPADAMTAVLAVTALAYQAGDRARVSPDGFIAQRFDREFNGHGHWVLTYPGELGLELRVFDDDAVADCPRLTYTPAAAESS